eukprot:12029100-Ditylum_brightwellii.AAC.1
MDCHCKNARSTKLKAVVEHCDEPPVEQKDKTHAIFIALGITDADDTVYTDLTGKFPVTSDSGSQYMLIAYNYDSNGIIAMPLKGRNDIE